MPEVLIVDDEEVPLLQIRKLTFQTGAASDNGAAAAT